jgi:hypothetical protein
MGNEKSRGEVEKNRWVKLKLKHTKENVWNSVKTVHRGKLICINADIKNSDHMMCNPSYL